MRAALATAVATADALVMAAAVADFRPARRVSGKLSRRSRADGGTNAWTLSLAANPDLLAELGQSFAQAGRGVGARRRPMLIGFAAEPGPFSDPLELERRARAKLLEKKCDVMVANEVGAPGTGFGADDNAVTLVFADGAVEPLGRAPKRELASAIWDRLAGRLLAGPVVAPGRKVTVRAGDGGRRAAAVRPARSRPRRVRGERA
jgi:phosphopantothenoylcysteine decarboxylase/phosphopantothenate--cysteine ligase